MEEKPEIELESKIDWQIKGGSARKAGQWGRQGQPGLGSALLGWVLGRLQSGQGRWGWQAGWLGWAGGTGRARRQAGQLGWAGGLGFAGLGPRQVAGRAAGARLGFAGLGPRQVAVRAGQVGLAGRLAWLGRLAGLARQGRAVGAWLDFAGLSPRQAGRGQPGLGSDLLGWVLGRWQSGQGRWGWQAGWLGWAGGAAWLGRLGSGVDRGSWGSARLCWAETEAGGAVGAARARLGFAGLGPRQVGQVGHAGRQAGFSGQVGLAGRLAWLGSSALLGWVLGRWQSGQGSRGLAWLCWARSKAGGAVRGGSALLGCVLGRWGSQGQAGAAGAWLSFAGLGPRQVAGRAGQPGLGLALLGWVLGRWGWEAGWLGWADGAGRARRQAFGQAGAAGAAGARLGFAGLGPRQVGQVGQSRAARACLGLAVAWFSFAGQVVQVDRQGQGRLAATVDLSGVAGLLLNKESYLRVEKDRNGAGWAGLGWVLGRMELAWAWLGLRYGRVGLGWARLGLAGLGPGQVGKDGAGLALARLGVVQAGAWLGWVLGRDEA
ncbi:hypothetical protein BY996DRAFT_6436469 [Phakopsora pachyrhizi]|nr:hypothetical protein BY996DRAFT_6436469 [Phakopsora pachyrhizi]